MDLELESPFARTQLNNAIANKASGICTECELEKANDPRFDGQYCTACADYLETTIR